MRPYAIGFVIGLAIALIIQTFNNTQRISKLEKQNQARQVRVLKHFDEAILEDSLALDSLKRINIDSMSRDERKNYISTLDIIISRCIARKELIEVIK